MANKYIWLCSIVLITVNLIRGSLSEGSFMCYTCSYGERDGNLHRDCITHPDTMGSGHHLNCTRNCVFQEQYDKNKKMVTSYFRSCNVPIGNECNEDYTHITCMGTCQGDFCNRDQTGTRYELYQSRHSNGDNDNDVNAANVFTMTTAAVVAVACHCVFAIVLNT